MKNFRELLLKSTVAMLTLGVTGFLLPRSSYAQAPDCDSIVQMSEIELGTVCTKRIDISTGKADWPRGRESVTVEYVPPTQEWLIRDFSNPIEDSVSNGRVKQFKPVSAGEQSEIRSRLASEYREIERTKNEFDQEVTVPIKGIPVNLKASLKKLSELEQANRNISDIYSTASSNVGKLIIIAEANGICKTRIFGECVDGVGGWYSGHVNVTQVYVGNVEAHLTNVRNTIEDVKADIRKWGDCAEETQSTECEPTNGGNESPNEGNESPNGGSEPPNGGSEPPNQGILYSFMQFIQSIFRSLFG